MCFTMHKATAAWLSIGFAGMISVTMIRRIDRR
jgi:hypothetical protein